MIPSIVLGEVSDLLVAGKNRIGAIDASVRLLQGGATVRNFNELRAKMSPAAQGRSAVRAEALLMEMRLQELRKTPCMLVDSVPSKPYPASQGK